MLWNVSNFTSNNTRTEMKLFQYDKKVWDEGAIDRTWQFGIINIC
jgi:hypothetical protein